MLLGGILISIQNVSSKANKLPQQLFGLVELYIDNLLKV